MGQRLVMLLALATAAYILVFWFPLSTLWSQQVAIDQARSQIAQLSHESAALAAQAKSISTESAAVALARQEYQLVLPGQSLIQVLPSNQTTSDNLSTGDPGLQPLVSPTAAGLGVSTGTVATTSPRAPLSGFWHRFVATLEFWR
ncbi:MAG: septum formation initiator family protein [Acidobacteria bacterium]|nr:septum formation initiator family protein [Acidobacteriota bacterium]